VCEQSFKNHITYYCTNAQIRPEIIENAYGKCIYVAVIFNLQRALFERCNYFLHYCYTRSSSSPLLLLLLLLFYSFFIMMELYIYMYISVVDLGVSRPTYTKDNQISILIKLSANFKNSSTKFSVRC